MSQPVLRGLYNGPLLEDRDPSPNGIKTYYLGPLDAGITLAEHDRTLEVYGGESAGQTPAWRAYLCNIDWHPDESLTGPGDPKTEDQADEGAEEWGTGDSREEAIRYALGAMFGPFNEGYDDDHLRRVLAAIADPVPETLTPENVERWLTT